MSRSRRPCVTVLIVAVFFASVLPAGGQEAIQRGAAFAEALLPVGLFLAQGADTLPRLAAVGAAALFATAPNALMLISEASGDAVWTRSLRVANFWIDAVAAAGSLGVGVALWAGAFGVSPSNQTMGAVYVALSLPLAFGALMDSMPFAVEAATP